MNGPGHPFDSTPDPLKPVQEKGSSAPERAADDFSQDLDLNEVVAPFPPWGVCPQPGCGGTVYLSPDGRFFNGTSLASDLHPHNPTTPTPPDCLLADEMAQACYSFLGEGPLSWNAGHTLRRDASPQDAVQVYERSASGLQTLMERYRPLRLKNPFTQEEHPLLNLFWGVQRLGACLRAYGLLA